MARFHAEPLSPEAAFVINPWWVLAHSSMSRSCIPERGWVAARTGTGGPDLTEIVCAADHGRIRVGNRTESDRDRLGARDHSAAFMGQAARSAAVAIRSPTSVVEPVPACSQAARIRSAMSCSPRKSIIIAADSTAAVGLALF